MSEGPATILIVDDNEMNRDMLSRRLGKQGYVTRAVSGGIEALEAVATGGLDVVLLDIMMPGIDGYETLRRIRTSHSASELPVIMATAKDEGSDIVQALELGANDYVTKPFDYPVVRARVGTQVQLKRAHEALDLSHTRMTNDLAAAARIQSSLLPEAEPATEACAFRWHFQPCDELAGDGLNVQQLEDGTVAFYMIDVSGHGVPAALLSVSIVHSLHPAPGPASVIWQAAEDGFELRSPDEVASRLAALYPMSGNGGLYFTMIYGLLDPGTGMLRLVSAGHPLPVVIHADGTAKNFGTASPPVGLVDNVDYAESSLQLTEGDRVFLYSDGLTEVWGPDDEMFGDERIVDLLAETRSVPMGELAGTLSEFVLGWSGVEGFDDDLSMLMFEFDGGGDA